MTFGDYALPNRRIEGRPRAVTSRIGHMARAGKRVGGRGKSTLARLFVDRRRTQYRGICWIDASGEDGLRKAMVWLAKTLDPALSGETDADTLCARARDLIERSRARWLLVFDNAEDQASLRRWLRDGVAGLMC